MTTRLPPSTAPQLPLDIIFSEILPKLPVKSLSRFKTVSKSFNILISSSDFIRRHLRQYHSPENRLLNVSGTMCSVESYNLDSLPSDPSATFIFPKCVTLVGACNGLLCIWCNNEFVILNPLTRTGVRVPSPMQFSVLGFGYDEVTDDYKILVISHSNDLRNTFVYSVNFKLWKLVYQTSDFPAANMEAWCRSVLLDNHLLHWTILGRIGRKICCFDLCTETWKNDVPLPSWCPDSNSPHEIGVFHGYLSTTLHIVDECVQVWVMKEYGVQESWSKLMSIPSSLYGDNGAFVPVSFRGMGSSELLVRERSHLLYCPEPPKLMWYNLENDPTRDATSVALNYPYRFYTCNGSLVTLPGAKPFEALYEPDRSKNVS